MKLIEGLMVYFHAHHGPYLTHIMVSIPFVHVGSVGIVTTLYTLVNDRVSEIGTMKAIGAKNTFILALFLSEALQKRGDRRVSLDDAIKSLIEEYHFKKTRT